MSRLVGKSRCTIKIQSDILRVETMSRFGSGLRKGDFSIRWRRKAPDTFSRWIPVFAAMTCVKQCIFDSGLWSAEKLYE